MSSSKIIQSLGQTEMRVGMRSPEFGNISIRTSSTPGVISAQISLDHSDLAKVLVTHLPEMQAKLSEAQSGSIQSAMNEKSAATSQDSSKGSSQNPQQSGQYSPVATSSRATQSDGAEVIVYSPAFTAVSNGLTDTRLDIRV
jgi:hypothetical protein